MPQEVAPYVSIDWMRSFLQRIRRTTGLVLNKELATQVGATGNNWTQLLRAGRELGIVDEGGRLTEDIGLGLAAGGRRAEQAAREIVLRAYPSLVPRLQGPLSSEDLKLHFYDLSRRERGRPLGESARRQAVALFRFWIEQTGEPAWLASLSAPRSSRAETPPAPRAPRRVARNHAPPLEEAAETLEEAIAEHMPFYRAVISVPARRRLTPEEWDFLRASVDAKIEFLKRQQREAA